MKVLSIVWYKVLPPLYGGQKGIALFNKNLATHSDLTCLCSADNIASNLPYKLRPQLPTSKKQFFDPKYWTLISRVAKEEQATHIILEHPYHGIAAVKACRLTGAKLIVHSHNIESERFRNLGKRGWMLLARYEKWVHQHAALSLFKTEKDMQLAIQKFGLDKNRCEVVPYGIEADGYSKVNDQKSANAATIRNKHGIAANERILLFCGTLDYTPNAEAVEAIFSEVAPRLQALHFPFRILICGRNKFSRFHYLDKLKHPAVSMLPEVDDMETYFSAADVFINPVAAGGGIQTKTIDAIASHCNVVGFDEMLDNMVLKYAAEKVYPVKPGDWQSFAEKIVIAAGNNHPAPERFFQHFSWKRITAELAERISRI